MYVKTLLASVLLAVLPAMSYAECSARQDTSDQALSCLPGTTWDQAAGECIESATS